MPVSCFTRTLSELVPGLSRPARTLTPHGYLRILLSLRSQVGQRPLDYTTIASLFRNVPRQTTEDGHVSHSMRLTRLNRRARRSPRPWTLCCPIHRLPSPSLRTVQQRTAVRACLLLSRRTIRSIQRMATSSGVGRDCVPRVKHGQFTTVSGRALRGEHSCTVHALKTSLTILPLVCHQPTPQSQMQQGVITM